MEFEDGMNVEDALNRLSLNEVVAPTINEVIDANVVSVREKGLKCAAGDKVEIYVSYYLNMPRNLFFVKGKEGQSAIYMSVDGSIMIGPNTPIRIRITGMVHFADRILCIGSIIGEGLGSIPQAAPKSSAS